jgi:hypothetical protein
MIVVAKTVLRMNPPGPSYSAAKLVPGKEYLTEEILNTYQRNSIASMDSDDVRLKVIRLTMGRLTIYFT